MVFDGEKQTFFEVGELDVKGVYTSFASSDNLDCTFIDISSGDINLNNITISNNDTTSRKCSKFDIDKVVNSYLPASVNHILVPVKLKFLPNIMRSVSIKTVFANDWYHSEFIKYVGIN